MQSSPLELGLYNGVDTGWPRVPKHVYKRVFLVTLPIIVLPTIIQLGIKTRKHRRLEINDWFLLLALFFALSAWSVVWQMRDLIYLQMELVLGMKVIDLEAAISMSYYIKLYNVTTVLSWFSMYSVKLSFMFFFRKLICRVRSLELYWWSIMVVLIPTAVTSGFFSFWICTDFSLNFVVTCPVNSMVHREEIYLYVTSALDIFTDILIISIPIILLSKVRISFKRKVVLGMGLCLSVLMVIICLIRVTTCKLPIGVIDSTWLALWQAAETNTAIITVSLTAFRSLYGQGASAGKATHVRITNSSRWPSIRTFKIRGRRQRLHESVPSKSSALPEMPRRAALFTKRGAMEDETEGRLLPSLRKDSDSLELTITKGKSLDLYHPCRWPSGSESTSDRNSTPERQT